MHNIRTFEELYNIYNTNEGYIKLSSPVINKQILAYNINKMSEYLGIEQDDINKLVNFNVYLVKPLDDNSVLGKIVTKDQAIKQRHIESLEFLIGSDAIRYLLDKINDLDVKKELSKIFIYTINISNEISIEVYKKILNRSIRIEKIIELNAPYLIVENEKMLLQLAVDETFDI